MADFKEMELTFSNQAAAYIIDDEKAMEARQKLCDAHSSFKVKNMDKESIKDLATLIFHMVAESKTTEHIVSGKIQCPSGRRRSSEDVYMCARYYLKGIDYTTVLKALMACTEGTALFTKNFCSMVLLRVFFNRYEKATLEAITQVLEANGLNYKAPIKKVLKKLPAKNVVRKTVKRKV